MGTIGAVALPAMKQADRDLKRMQTIQRSIPSQFFVPNTFTQLTTAPVAKPLPTLDLRAAATEQARQRIAAQARQTAERDAANLAQSQANVRKAERERDLAHEKEEQLSHLQKSIDWYDGLLRDMNTHAGKSNALAKERDRLLEQRRKLQGY